MGARPVRPGSPAKAANRDQRPLILDDASDDPLRRRPPGRGEPLGEAGPDLPRFSLLFFLDGNSPGPRIRTLLGRQEAWPERPAPLFHSGPADYRNLRG